MYQGGEKGLCLKHTGEKARDVSAQKEKGEVGETQEKKRPGPRCS